MTTAYDAALSISCPVASCQAKPGQRCRYPAGVLGMVERDEPHPERVAAVPVTERGIAALMPVIERDMAARKPLVYMAHPVAPDYAQLDADIAREVANGLHSAEYLRARIASAMIDHNLRRAKRWLRWFAIHVPQLVVIAPWVAAVESSIEAGCEERMERERELAVCREVVRRCDAIALVGGRVSGGMASERGEARFVIDLTGEGEEPPTSDEGIAAALGRITLAVEEMEGRRC